MTLERHEIADIGYKAYCPKFVKYWFDLLLGFLTKNVGSNREMRIMQKDGEGSFFVKRSFEVQTRIYNKKLTRLVFKALRMETMHDYCRVIGDCTCDAEAAKSWKQSKFTGVINQDEW
jgi:hypothetical protein